jgi:hypothetical protein
MTDDTLRKECEDLLAELLTDSPIDRVSRLLTFARAQQAKGEKINQAKGLREAAELIQDSMKPGAAMPMREQMIDYLLNHAWALEHQKGAQATAREAELPTRRDP